MRFYYLDALGWPVETIKGRPVLNFIRRLIHTCKITTKRPICLDGDAWPNSPRDNMCQTMRNS